MTSSQALSAAAMALSFARPGGSDEAIRLENGAGPALPGGIDHFGLGKPKEMTFGG
jgi:hypothetical protein